MDFVNYLVEILRMKSFQKDFGKPVVKLPVTYYKSCKGNIMEKRPM